MAAGGWLLVYGHGHGDVVLFHVPTVLRFVPSLLRPVIDSPPVTVNSQPQTQALSQ
jgi:hypothetical protein